MTTGIARRTYGRLRGLSGWWVYQVGEDCCLIPPPPDRTIPLGEEGGRYYLKLADGGRWPCTDALDVLIREALSTEPPAKEGPPEGLDRAARAAWWKARNAVLGRGRQPDTSPHL